MYHQSPHLPYGGTVLREPDDMDVKIMVIPIAMTVKKYQFDVYNRTSQKPSIMRKF